MCGKDIARKIIELEIPVIRKMIEDECWYEGERRKAPVAPNDPVIRKRIAELIMAHGETMRAEAMKRIETEEN